MILKAFSLYDSKGCMFNTPFFMHNEGMAIRSFMELTADASTMVAKYPEDFSLFLIGEFDDAVGELRPLAHVNLGTAASYKRPVTQPARPLSPHVGSSPVLVAPNGDAAEVSR